MCHVNVHDHAPFRDPLSSVRYDFMGNLYTKFELSIFPVTKIKKEKASQKVDTCCGGERSLKVIATVNIRYRVRTTSYSF